MEQYFPVVSRSSSFHESNCERDKKRLSTRYEPYKLKYTTKDKRDETNKQMSPQPWNLSQIHTKSSKAAVTKYLLSTLSDVSNPITHSDIRERSDRVVSTSTGHQISEGQRNRRLYLEDRERKLTSQREGETPGSERPILYNVRIYIDGFLDGTTDIEMKRIVSRAGGQMVATASGCTHILTSQHLSGSKTHKILTTRNKVHVVKPEWVTDSVKAGRRRPEREYAVINNMGTSNIFDMLQK